MICSYVSLLQEILENGGQNSSLGLSGCDQTSDIEGLARCRRPDIREALVNLRCCIFVRYSDSDVVTPNGLSLRGDPTVNVDCSITP